ncbi:hypothetical protein [Achromobacter animicus]|uniref:hypothetical protein n=1 Tax=Achromobacter animicus TaxID=1389935 RepID=UPI0028ADD696|nr:hypothetical protein [Achromobacter animicus]
MNDLKKAAHIAALRNLRLGVEMDRHNLDDGDAKLAALDTAIDALRAPVADERAAFEFWMTTQGLGVQRDGDSYLFTYAQRAWATWQARAALASAPVASAEVMDALDWVDDFIARGNRDGRGSCDSVNVLRRALASAPLAEEAQSQAKYQRMFVAACEALAAISERLGLDPNDGEPDVILSAIGELMGRAHDAAPQASEAERDAAFEAVRKRLCAIPRYSFYLDDDGVVRRVEGCSGNWIEFDAAHELFDPVAVDAALSAQPGAQKESRDA